MLHLGYLDPATGTLIVSAVVGFFAAGALVAKNFWYRITGSLGRNGSRDGQREQTPSEASVQAID